MPSVVGKGASVAAVSPTLPATVQTAVAPAPAPKPATATLPVASTGAKTAAPARSTSTSAEEAEKARRRASFEAESKAAQEELGATAGAMRSKYLEAVGKIAETRRSGEIGQPTIMGGYYSAAAPGGYVAPVVATPSAQSVRPNPKGRAEPLPAVRPSTVPGAPTAEELDVPMRAAMKAEEIDSAYKAALAAHEAGQADIKQKEADPNFPRSQFPALAQAQRARLQRVAELAAARREYGLGE